MWNKVGLTASSYDLFSWKLLLFVEVWKWTFCCIIQICVCVGLGSMLLSVTAAGRPSLSAFSYIKRRWKQNKTRCFFPFPAKGIGLCEILAMHCLYIVNWTCYPTHHLLPSIFLFCLRQLVFPRLSLYIVKRERERENSGNGFSIFWSIL